MLVLNYQWLLLPRHIQQTWRNQRNLACEKEKKKVTFCRKRFLSFYRIIVLHRGLEDLDDSIDLSGAQITTKLIQATSKIRRTYRQFIMCVILLKKFGYLIDDKNKKGVIILRGITLKVSRIKTKIFFHGLP